MDKNKISLIYGIEIPDVISKELMRKYDYEFRKTFSKKCDIDIYESILIVEQTNVIGFRHPSTILGYIGAIIKINDKDLNEWLNSEPVKKAIEIVIGEILVTWRDYEIANSDVNKEILLPESLEFNWYAMGF